MNEQIPITISISPHSRHKRQTSNVKNERTLVPTVSRRRRTSVFEMRRRACSEEQVGGVRARLAPGARAVGAAGPRVLLRAALRARRLRRRRRRRLAL